MSPPRLKVLLSAYACEPGKGSEPYVGWSWAMQLREFCDVTVLTRANNRPGIEKAMGGEKSPHLNFLYYDPPRLFLRLKKLGLPIAIFYVVWQIGARYFVGDRVRSFDIVHHVTFNSFLAPGFWWFDEPAVVLGPLGGGMTSPSEMMPLFRGRILSESIRHGTVSIGAVNPFLRRSFQSAKKILAANEDTRRRIAPCFQSKVESLLETGIPSSRLGTEPPARTPSDTFRLVWIGSLVSRKAPVLAVAALEKCLTMGANVRLHIIGEGYERRRLEVMIKERGLGSSVSWSGWLAHDEVLVRLREADALLFTSARDTSGNVLLEAMATGLPSIVVAHQGAGEIATGETSVLIAPERPDILARRIADAVVTLASDRGLCVSLGKAAWHRVRESYTWEAKAARMREIYRELAAAA